MKNLVRISLKIRAKTRRKQQGRELSRPVGPAQPKRYLPPKGGRSGQSLACCGTRGSRGGYDTACLLGRRLGRERARQEQSPIHPARIQEGSWPQSG